jgi:hypothetical protein
MTVIRRYIREGDVWDSPELVHRLQPQPEPAEQKQDKRIANRKLAQRIIDHPAVSSEQVRLTFQAFPDLEAAYNGTFSGDLDWKRIHIIAPEEVRRFAGTDIEAARFAKQLKDADTRRRDIAAIESQRGHAGSNATLGRRQQFEK